MTKDADFKRIVRARAVRTGESYQTAFRRLRPGADAPTSTSVDDDAAAMRAEFERVGIVRLHDVFSAESAEAMREVVWRSWGDAYGVRRDDPSTWNGVPDWGRTKDAKRHPRFRDILGPKLLRIADVLLGTGWTTSNGFGSLLVSFPDAERWHLPARDAMWHIDGRFVAPPEPVTALRVFAVFGDVPPGGGGTLLVEGSHRMVARFVAGHPNVGGQRARDLRAACHTSNAWLRDLTLGNPVDPSREQRFMHETSLVDGIPARVIEACGRPGDVFVCHPWTIHCRPPNAATQPRFLRSPTLCRPWDRDDGGEPEPDGGPSSARVC
jgi:hypothetical protein